MTSTIYVLGNLNIHHHGATAEQLASIATQLESIMTTQAEFAQQLRDAKEQLDRSRAEIVAKIAALEAAVGNAGPISDEVAAAFADLKASVQATDDVADPIEPPPAP